MRLRNVRSDVAFRRRSYTFGLYCRETKFPKIHIVWAWVQIFLNQTTN